MSNILTSHKALIMGNREQVGIAEAFTQLMNQVRLDHADDPLILFLEEDFRVDSDILKPSSTASRLKEAAYMLQSADVVRLRSRKNPGAPDCYHVLFSRQMHLLPVFARLSSAMWLEDEELRTQFATIEQCENESLCAQSNEAEWTNNPFLARLSWILDYVVPIAEADYATLGSSANLETPLREVPFLWSDQNFRVVQTRGMFTHDDVDKPMEEQSWPCGLLHVRMKKEGLE